MKKFANPAKQSTDTFYFSLSGASPHGFLGAFNCNDQSFVCHLACPEEGRIVVLPTWTYFLCWWLCGILLTLFRALEGRAVSKSKSLKNLFQFLFQFAFSYLFGIQSTYNLISCFGFNFFSCITGYRSALFGNYFTFIQCRWLFLFWNLRSCCLLPACSKPILSWSCGREGFPSSSAYVSCIALQTCRSMPW